MTDIDPSTGEHVPEPRTLLEAVNRLSGHVVALTERLDVTRRQAVTTRRLVAAVIALVVVVAGISALLFWRIHEDVNRNTQNAVQGCENANDQRQANLTLWEYILDASAKPDATPKQNQQATEFRAWVEVLFQQHDCGDLGKVYEIPPPPKVE